MFFQIYCILLLLLQAKATWNPLPRVKCLPDETEGSPPAVKPLTENLPVYRSAILEGLTGLLILFGLLYGVAKYYAREMTRKEITTKDYKDHTTAAESIDLQENFEKKQREDVFSTRNRSESRGSHLTFDKPSTSPTETVPYTLNCVTAIPEENFQPSTKTSSLFTEETNEKLPLEQELSKLFVIIKETKMTKLTCVEMKTKANLKTNFEVWSPPNSPKGGLSLSKTNENLVKKPLLAKAVKKQTRRDVSPFRLPKKQTPPVGRCNCESKIALDSLEKEVKILRKTICSAEKIKRDAIRAANALQKDLTKLRSALKEAEKDKDSLTKTVEVLKKEKKEAVRRANIRWKERLLQLQEKIRIEAEDASCKAESSSGIQDSVFGKMESAVVKTETKTKIQDSTDEIVDYSGNEGIKEREECEIPGSEIRDDKNVNGNDVSKNITMEIEIVEILEDKTEENESEAMPDGRVAEVEIMEDHETLNEGLEKIAQHEDVENVLNEGKYFVCSDEDGKRSVSSEHSLTNQDNCGVLSSETFSVSVTDVIPPEGSELGEKHENVFNEENADQSQINDEPLEDNTILDRVKEVEDNNTNDKPLEDIEILDHIKEEEDNNKPSNAKEIVSSDPEDEYVESSHPSNQIQLKTKNPSPHTRLPRKNAASDNSESKNENNKSSLNSMAQHKLIKSKISRVNPRKTEIQQEVEQRNSRRKPSPTENSLRKPMDTKSNLKSPPKPKSPPCRTNSPRKNDNSSVSKIPRSGYTAIGRKERKKEHSENPRVPKSYVHTSTYMSITKCKKAPSDDLESGKKEASKEYTTENTESVENKNCDVTKDPVADPNVPHKSRYKPLSEIFHTDESLWVRFDEGSQSNICNIASGDENKNSETEVEENKYSVSHGGEENRDDVPESTEEIPEEISEHISEEIVKITEKISEETIEKVSEYTSGDETSELLDNPEDETTKLPDDEERVKIEKDMKDRHPSVSEMEFVTKNCIEDIMKFSSSFSEEDKIAIDYLLGQCFPAHDLLQNIPFTQPAHVESVTMSDLMSGISNREEMPSTSSVNNYFPGQMAPQRDVDQLTELQAANDSVSSETLTGLERGSLTGKLNQYFVYDPKKWSDPSRTLTNLLTMYGTAETEIQN